MGADSSTSRKLQKAIETCDYEGVRALLDKRADPNGGDPLPVENTRPLLLATLWGPQGFPVVEMLLEAKADPSIAHLTVRVAFSLIFQTCLHRIHPSCLFPYHSAAP